jgi:acyl-CoA thioesterase-2
VTNPAPPADAVSAMGLLFAILDLQATGEESYRAHSPAENPLGHVFGGQVVAQALRAAMHTVPPHFRAQSLHSYFMRGGDSNEPFEIRVERTRDGRSFLTRRVVAEQLGQAIFVLEASFHVDEPGASYQTPIASGIAEPDDAQTWTPRLGQFGAMFDMREFPPDPPDDRGVYGSAVRFWLRTRGALPDDPMLHAATLAYATDLGPAGAARLATDVPFGAGMSASLDHCVWFHRPVRVDDWLLFDFRPISNAGARGLVMGSVHTQDGTLAATVMQEVLTRPGR